MAIKETFDDRKGGNESARQIGKWRLAYDDQQSHAVLHDGIQLVRFVADTAVVSKGDPATLTDNLQPRIVGRLFIEMIRVALDGQASRSKNLRKALAQIAIGEIDKAQAARS